MPENLIQSSNRSGVTASIAKWRAACRSKSSVPKNDVPGRLSTGGDTCGAAARNPRILPQHHPLHPLSCRSGCVSSRTILLPRWHLPELDRRIPATRYEVPTLGIRGKGRDSFLVRLDRAQRSTRSHIPKPDRTVVVPADKDAVFGDEDQRPRAPLLF